jgi:23S rRNA (uracil1939-C5)-methyltransferase
MPLQPGADLIVTIEKPVSGGRMLARHDGQIVFVAGAIPGERVRVRVQHGSKHLAFADTIDVLEPSPDRRPPHVDAACGGSLYAHVAYPRQLVLKSALVADTFERIAKIILPPSVEVMPSDEQGYRMRARLHAANGRFGFFREGSHEWCDAGATRQLLPATMDALGRLQTALRNASATDVTSCEVSENVAGDERAVLIEMASSRPAPLHLDPIDGITGVLFSDDRGPRLTSAYGTPYVSDTIQIADANVKLTRHVRSFFQGNRYLLSALVSRVAQQVPHGKVTDLYAGVGLFAVSLAALGRHDIFAVEGDRSSARDLESNASGAGAVRVAHMSVEDYLRRRSIERPDTLLLDPPRTGVSKEAMVGIITLAAPRIVYVSCDLATLARDVKRLAEADYSLTHIEAFDMFPNTPHVETLAVLTRGDTTSGR